MVRIDVFAEWMQKNFKDSLFFRFFWGGVLGVSTGRRSKDFLNVLGISVDGAEILFFLRDTRNKRLERW